MTPEEYIQRARESYERLLQAGNAKILGRCEAEISRCLAAAGVDYSALDPQGKRSHEEMLATTQQQTRDGHIRFAREAFNALRDDSGTLYPATFVNRINRSLEAAGVGHSALDPEGKHSDEEMAGLVQHYVDRTFIREAQESWEKLQQPQNLTPEHLLKRIADRLEQGNADYSALDPEGRRNHEEMYEAVVAREKAVYVELARDIYQKLLNENNTGIYDPDVQIGRMESHLASAGSEGDYTPLDAEGKRSHEDIAADVQDFTRQYHLSRARQSFIIFGQGQRSLSRTVRALGNICQSLDKADASFADIQPEAPALRHADARLEQYRAAEHQPHLSPEQLRSFQRLWDFVDSLPRLPEQGEVTSEMLFTADASGYAPVDNPQSWRDAEAWLPRLVPSAELLTRQSDKQAGFVEAMLDSAGAAKLMESLNDKGVRLGEKELLDAEGKPSSLCQQLLQQEGGKEALFSPQNWMGRLGELRRVYHALPERDRPQHFHSLQEKVRAAEPGRSAGIGR